MNDKNFLDETIIEMMMNTLINNYKKNKEEFIKGIISSDENEYIQVAPAGSPYMNEKIIKMALNFKLENYNILNFFERKDDDLSIK